MKTNVTITTDPVSLFGHASPYTSGQRVYADLPDGRRVYGYHMGNFIAYDAGSGRRLPATYANFLIVNGAVLVPAYGGPADEQARLVLGRCFPDRDIVPIDCRPLIRGFGSLHCVTMQIPAGVVPARTSEP